MRTAIFHDYFGAIGGKIFSFGSIKNQKIGI